MFSIFIVKVKRLIIKKGHRNCHATYAKDISMKCVPIELVIHNYFLIHSFKLTGGSLRSSENIRQPSYSRWSPSPRRNYHPIIRQPGK